jgi:hypothetical protein
LSHSASLKEFHLKCHFHLYRINIVRTEKSYKPLSFASDCWEVVPVLAWLSVLRASL